MSKTSDSQDHSDQAIPYDINYSFDFVLCSGTVTVDLRRGVLLTIKSLSTGVSFLPRGRKRAGETLITAAVRATREQTRIDCRPLQHDMRTLAPAPASTFSSNTWTTEPLAMYQQVVKGKREVIFWYITEADSSLGHGTHEQAGTPDFAYCWATKEQAWQALTYDADRIVVRIALQAVCRLSQAVAQGRGP
ncbi:MAG: hypothetical protein M1825_005098 [Sarcosagium campestre]|nr:MAG: hypothetical protein M1825_005098 [Sarcosagium campestre]